MIDDIPCKECDHKEEQHLYGLCLGCYEDERLTDHQWFLEKLEHDFTPDNIKYFEAQYKKQILSKFQGDSK